jgi:hypothetical protein
MISDISRKRITLAALICALSVLADMFLVFLQSEERLTTILFLVLGISIVLNGSLIWLGVSLFFFYKEETSGIVETDSTVIIEQNVEKKEKWKQPLFQSSLLTIAGGSITIPVNIITSLVILEVLIAENAELIINIIAILPALLLFVGFVQLKRVLDSFAVKKRNIYKGQTSLPLGYLMIVIYIIIITIVPAESMVVETAEGVTIKEGYQILFYLVYFLDIGQEVMFVLGFWYLRRVFTVLDKIPEEYFERRRKIIEEAQARRQSGFRGGIFGNTQTLGKVVPQAPIKEEEKEIDQETPATYDKKMFCVKCGLELEDDATFCANCGERNPYL